MALISLEFYETRYGAGDDDQLEAFIDDASALVVDYVTALHVDASSWDETTTPPGVQSVVAQMVSRTLFNPQGLTGENLGDHGWQNNPRSAVGMMIAPSEKRAIRHACGLPVGGILQLDTDLPLPAEYDDTFDELV